MKGLVEILDNDRRVGQYRPSINECRYDAKWIEREIGCRQMLLFQNIDLMTDPLRYAFFRQCKKQDRKRVVSGQSVSVRVDIGGRGRFKTNNKYRINVDIR